MLVSANAIRHLSFIGISDVLGGISRWVTSRLRIARGTPQPFHRDSLESRRPLADHKIGCVRADSMNAIRRLCAATFVLSICCAQNAGCHAIPDPSCSIRNELADGRCRRCLYCPDVCTDPLRYVDWYRCPVCWKPECPPISNCLEIPPRKIATADELFATPEK